MKTPTIKFRRVSEPGRGSRIDAIVDGKVVADIVTGADCRRKRQVYVTIFKSDGVHVRLERRTQETAKQSLREIFADK